MGKVFVSYSHDTPEHAARVLDFANSLRRLGVDVELDRFHVRPEQGWPHWIEEQLKPDVSEYVLVVCTKTFRERVEDKIAADEGKGVYWEGALIHQYIYNEKANHRFIPVLIDGAVEDDIPMPLRSSTRYRISRFEFADRGFDDLYCELTNQNESIKAHLGAVVDRRASRRVLAKQLEPLEVREVRTTFTMIAPTRLRQGATHLFGRKKELALLDQAWADPRIRVLTFVAWGGVGKTSLVVEWMNRQAAAGWPGFERVFDWSFYSQGARDQSMASADSFVKAALEFFGDPELAASIAGAWDKGAKLAQLVAAGRNLLVLDGLEPMQYPPGPMGGRLKDPALQSLLQGLARLAKGGLCVITTRESMEDLAFYRDVTCPEHSLENLSLRAGVELLKACGVKGTTVDIQAIVNEVWGHALTISLLGTYLAKFHGGDIRKAQEVELEKADAMLNGGHAFKTISAYERRLAGGGTEGERQRAVLRLMGLFDRFADASCIAALRQKPVIRDLTKPLIGLSEPDWNLTLRALEDFKLLTVHPNGDVEAHPLVREYFATQLKTQHPKAWQAAQQRLSEHLKLSPTEQAAEKVDRDGRGTRRPGRVFVSYSHADRKWMDRVRKHLGVMKLDRSFEVWDRPIAVSSDWREEVDEPLNVCDVAVLLISSDYLASEFVRTVELPRLLERRAREGVPIIPLIVSPCPWRTVPWLQSIQCRPLDGKPLAAMSRVKQSSVLSALAEEIASLLERLLRRKPTPVPPEAASPCLVFSQLPETDAPFFDFKDVLNALDDAWADASSGVIEFVAEGGTGKTAAVGLWLKRLEADAWRGARRVFAWSFHGQGKSEGHEASEDGFLEKALEWFGVRCEPSLGPDDKGRLLADAVICERVLLILDGVEPLLYPPGPMKGQLRAKGLRALIQRLATNGQPSLCVVTSRDELADLRGIGRLLINVVHLSSLRDRPNDIQQLAEHFFRLECERVGRTAQQLSSRTLEAMKAYSWPGNIRELQSYIAKSVLLLPELDGSPAEPVEFPDPAAPVSVGADGPEGAARVALASGDLHRASTLLTRIMRSDAARRDRLQKEFAFILDLSTRLSAADLERYRRLWQVLARGTGFALDQVAEPDVASVPDSNVALPTPEPATPTSAPSDARSPGDLGAALEEAMVALFRELFVLKKETADALLQELRRQRAGLQFGYDVEAAWAVCDADVRCLVECKNYADPVSLADVADKLIQVQELNAEVQHWILVSPRADVTNELNLLLKKWTDEQRFPFRVQVWSPATLVDEFFGLSPALYDAFGFRPSEGSPHPRDWTAARREDVRRRWLDKLAPWPRLPPAWRRYVAEPDRVRLYEEESEQLAALETRQIPLQGRDETGNVLPEPLEATVRRWLEEPVAKCPTLFLVGEFGDGKTAFTFLLARSLLADFRADPAIGWLPLRIALRGFSREGVHDARDLLKRRLDEFGADIDGWNDIRTKHRVLVVLDGFDEMSGSLDPETIRANARKLVDCWTEEFAGLKVLFTSRPHFLSDPRIRRELLDRLSSPPLIQLQRFDRARVESRYEEMATTPEARERLVALRTLHDPIGLATKPLFYQMVADTVFGGSEQLLGRDFNEVALYEAWVRQCLLRKRKGLEHDRMEALTSELVDRMLEVLDVVAFGLRQAESEYICLLDLVDRGNIRPDFAQALWDLGSPEEQDEADAVARVGSRSVLRRVATGDEHLDPRWPVDFCHRSLREFFVGRMLYRALIDGGERASSHLGDIVLNPEIRHFVTRYVQVRGTRDVVVPTLVALARSTRAARVGEAQANDLATARRLGCNAATLLCGIEPSLPDADWSGLLLDGADLSRADLSGKDFSGTSLRHAILDNANLENADFRQADLTGVRIEETTPVVAVAPLPGANAAYAAYEDGVVRRWTLQGISPAHDVVLQDIPLRAGARLTARGSGESTLITDRTVYVSIQGEDSRLLQIAEFPLRADVGWAGLAEGSALLWHQPATEAPGSAVVIDFDGPAPKRTMPAPGVVLWAIDRWGTVVLFGNDGRWTLSTDDANDIEFAMLPGIEPRCVAVTSLKVSGHCEIRVACGCRDGRVVTRPFVLSEGKIEPGAVSEAAVHSSPVSCVSWIDSDEVLSGGMDGVVAVFAPSRGSHQNTRRFALSLRCRGLRVEGLKGDHERLLFEKRIEAARGT